MHWTRHNLTTGGLGRISEFKRTPNVKLFWGMFLKQSKDIRRAFNRPHSNNNRMLGMQSGSLQYKDGYKVGNMKTQGWIITGNYHQANKEKDSWCRRKPQHNRCGHTLHTMAQEPGCPCKKKAILLVVRIVQAVEAQTTTKLDASPVQPQ